jgi:hypothetical protein
MKIKYIAAYQSNPVSAVTHVAPVSSIEPYGEDGKFKLIFSETGPINWADSIRRRSVWNRAGTALHEVRAVDGSKKVADLFPK